MKHSINHKIATFGIALVWLVNGLYCKVLNYVPRHQEKVARILGGEYATHLTKLIGLGEIAMAIWILWGVFPKLNVWTQITLIVLMNILEFILVPDLLLWGKGNFIFALIFAGLVYIHSYLADRKIVTHA